MSWSTKGTLMTLSAELKCVLFMSSLPQPVTTVRVPFLCRTRSAIALFGRHTGTIYFEKVAGCSKRSRAMSLSMLLLL